MLTLNYYILGSPKTNRVIRRIVVVIPGFLVPFWASVGIQKWSLTYFRNFWRASKNAPSSSAQGLSARVYFGNPLRALMNWEEVIGYKRTIRRCYIWSKQGDACSSNGKFDSWDWSGSCPEVSLKEDVVTTTTGIELAVINWKTRTATPIEPLRSAVWNAMNGPNWPEVGKKDEGRRTMSVS